MTDVSASENRRFLVYCPTEGGRIEAELFGEDRLFDVALNDWTESDQDHPSFQKSEYVFSHRSHKWPGVKVLLPKINRQYDYYAFIDDDISITTNELNYMFEIGEKNNLDLFQPALSRRSVAPYKLFHAQYNSNIRKTQFVEVMMPFFSKTALDKAFHTFDESESGWGLDYVWAKLFGYKNMAIVDSVVAEHLRPVRPGDENISCGVTRYGDLKKLEKKYGFILNTDTLKFRNFWCFVHKIVIRMPKIIQNSYLKFKQSVFKVISLCRNKLKQMKGKSYEPYFFFIGRIYLNNKMISAMVRVKNEGQFLRAAVLSIIDHVDEVVIINNKSSDNSASIIKDLLNEYPSKVKTFSYSHPIVGYGEDHQLEVEKNPNSPSLPSNYNNWSMDKCGYPYVLTWDGDMIATDEFYSLLKKFRGSKKHCLRFHGTNVFRDYMHSATKKVADEESRIYPKKFVSFKNGTVFEVVTGSILRNYMKTGESCYLHMKFCKKNPFSNCSSMQKNRLMNDAERGEHLPDDAKKLLGVLQFPHANSPTKSIGSSSFR